MVAGIAINGEAWADPTIRASQMTTTNDDGGRELPLPEDKSRSRPRSRPSLTGGVRIRGTPGRERRTFTGWNVRAGWRGDVISCRDRDVAAARPSWTKMKVVDGSRTRVGHPAARNGRDYTSASRVPASRPARVNNIRAGGCGSSY